MTNGLNWKEQMQWELYKQYLKTPKRVRHDNHYQRTVAEYYENYAIHEAYEQSKLATEQFINNLAADAREELEGSGWKEHNFQAMVESYQERWRNQRNGDCYNAVERALAGKPLNH